MASAAALPLCPSLRTKSWLEAFSLMPPALEIIWRRFWRPTSSYVPGFSTAPITATSRLWYSLMNTETWGFLTKRSSRSSASFLSTASLDIPPTMTLLRSGMVMDPSSDTRTVWLSSGSSKTLISSRSRGPMMYSLMNMSCSAWGCRRFLGRAGPRQYQQEQEPERQMSFSHIPSGPY